MSFRQLLLRNLLFFWRTNLAVLCGVIAATAVIGGALIVGDSVRDSLAEMSLVRLGKVDYAVYGGRVFREELASELEANSPLVSVVAPALITQGTAEWQQDTQTRRAGQLNVYGVGEKMWSLLDHGAIAAPGPGEIVINQRVADELQISEPGAELSVIVEIPASIPRDSLLGERDQTFRELLLTVTAILSDELGAARFGLNPSQQLPSNVFVSLAELQDQLGLAAVERSRRTPVAKPARVNAMFLSSAGASAGAGQGHSLLNHTQLTVAIKGLLTLEDLGLKLVTAEELGYWSLESEQMYLDDAIVTAANRTATEMALRTSPVLVYLVNEISQPETPENYSTYSVIAGLDPEESPPFGPFDFTGSHQPLGPGQVYLNDWVAEDLQADVGDSIRIRYHVVGDRGELPEAETEFEVAGIVKLEGPAADPGITPTVPGVTDADTYADWREPFPLKRDRITSRDDEYWELHRTTPKLFVSLEQAQELWKSRYGSLTSIRFAPKEGRSLEIVRDLFAPQLLHNIDTMHLGFGVQPVKAMGLAAAQGTTDFSGLFIGFSFFLILSATILVGLLFRLGVESRVAELGLMSAIGLPPKQVRRLLLAEGAILVVTGGLFGLVAAVGYASLMVYGLKTWWIGAIGTKFLFVSVHPLSLLIGFLIAVIVALVAVWWALRRTRGFSTRKLLMGDISDSDALKRATWSRSLAWTMIPGSLLLLVLTLTGIIPDSEAFAGFSWRVVMFFLVGVGILTGSLAALAVALQSNEAVPVRGNGSQGELRLGLRNAARQRTRSVMTASLIASATFVIVAVAAGRQDPGDQAPRADSGNGGFTLVAETNSPIIYDLNTPQGRAKLGFDPLETINQQLLESMHVAPFRVRPGENASCLNLYQTQLPTILGVPDDVLDDFIEQNRFRFADTPGEHPWSLLREELPSGNVPVLGDMNTLQYSLHKGIGATVDIPNQSTLLEIRGMFANSIFQGVLVMSESNFQKLFPEQAGFRYFLIEVSPAQAAELSQVLESNLGDYGFDAELVSSRLADFLAVQNTYLSTFQTLGGLGLLLGTIGLATVMLRNVLERRGEFALLRAIGFQQASVARLVIWENAVLLACGLLTGTVAALLAMSPHLLSVGSDLSWSNLLLMLGGVFLVGMLAAIVAVRAAMRVAILATLQGD